MIPDWKQAYKLYSVQLALVVAVIAGLEPLLPDLTSGLPDGWASVAAVVVVVARLVRQNKIQDSTPVEVWDAAQAAKRRK